MKFAKTLAFILLLSTTHAFAAKGDDPLLAKVMIDRLETQRDREGNTSQLLEADLWIGRDLNKLWFKTEVERIDNTIEEHKLQMLYSRAIAPYWDFQLGLRRDFKPLPKKDWLAIGFTGVAPYFIETDVALFINDEGQSHLAIQAEYELMLSQRLVLSPEVEANLFAKNEPQEGVGKGLSDAKFSLRLAYEIKREFAPYIGVNYRRHFGNSVDLIAANGEDTDETQLVAGLRIWF